MNHTHIYIDETKMKDVTHLALNRTIFAFERTALAYMRTSVTFLIASITLVKFFEERIIQYIGIALLPVVFYLMYLGLSKYKEINSVLKIHQNTLSKQSS